MDQQEQPSSQLSAPSKTGRPWLASCLLQRQVVNMATLEPIGRVADIVFDPQQSRVVGITVQPQDAPRGVAALIGRALRRSVGVGAVTLDHVVALNGDVVMIDADPVPLSHAQAFERMSWLAEVCELVVLTTYGMSLGSLADLLLDYRGGEVKGYVVKPTELAKSQLPLLEDMEEQESQLSMANVVDAVEVPRAPNPPASNLRVIPASSRIHFGDSLILLVTEVEPIQQNVVVISQPTVERPESQIASR